MSSAVVGTIVHQLYKDARLQGAQDLAPCGLAVVRMLNHVCDQLHSQVSTAHPTPLHEHDARVVYLSLSTLHTLAHEMINSIPFNIVPRHWLRLLTDTALLLGLHEAIQSCNKDERTNDSLIAAIGRMDMAIIVAGAIGPQRREWILETIHQLQTLLIPDNRGSTEQSELPRPAKRSRIEEAPPARTPVLSYAPNAVPVLDSPPTVDEYLEHHAQHPFIVRDFLSGHREDSLLWPAVEHWKSAEYLLRLSGRGRLVPVEIGGSYDDSEWGQKILPFEQFLRRSEFDDRNTSNPDRDDCLDNRPVYLAQYALLDQLPGLNKDISYPDFVWSNPPPTPAYPFYQAPQTEGGVIVNVWVGNGGAKVVSPAHTDPYYNCYAQVVGQKRVWLAPPNDGKDMYAYGTSGSEELEDGSDLADQYMTNTSKVPILRPTEDFQQHRSGYPRFFEHVWPESLEAVLGPGDLLVFPPGWWHAMRGEGSGPGWSVSMWY